MVMDEITYTELTCIVAVHPTHHLPQHIRAAVDK